MTVYIITKTSNQQQAINRSWGCQKLYMDFFDCLKVSAPNSHIVQGLNILTWGRNYSSIHNRSCSLPLELHLYLKRSISRRMCSKVEFFTLLKFLAKFWETLLLHCRESGETKRFDKQEYVKKKKIMWQKWEVNRNYKKNCC